MQYGESAETVVISNQRDREMCRDSTRGRSGESAELRMPTQWQGIGEIQSIGPFRHHQRSHSAGHTLVWQLLLNLPSSSLQISTKILRSVRDVLPA